MTILMIIGLVLLPFVWIVGVTISKPHREQTGVDMPSRSVMKRIRRRAREQGITEAEAYANWLERKQKKLYSAPKPPTPEEAEISVRLPVNSAGSEERITFKCTQCGSTKFVFPNQPPRDDDIIKCGGCKREIGRYDDIRAATIKAGKAEVDKLVN
jgi:hypothetical protein